MSDLVPMERIENKIITLRDRKVILAPDLAELYDVETRVLNQAVKRNIERFPSHFMFQLSIEEKQEVVTNCDHLRKLKYSPVSPYAFTEHGALMSANILNSLGAIQMSILIVETFINLRIMIQKDELVKARLDDLEDRLGAQEFQTLAVLDQLGAIKQQLQPSKSKKPLIGFSMPKKVTGK